MQFVNIFTTTADRGLALKAREGEIEALFAVEWKQEPQREAAIRAFFAALNTSPTEDYLAGNGGVADATRMLAYPLPGGPREVNALTRQILQDLCGVSASEPLDISYTER